MTTLYHHQHGGAQLSHAVQKSMAMLDFSVNISPLSSPIGALSLDTFSLQVYPSIDGRVHFFDIFQAVHQGASLHASPNAGYPECAFASPFAEV